MENQGNERKQKLTLTAVLIQDPESRRWTTFFEEIPQAVGEGDDKQAALRSAVDALSVFGRMNKREIESEFIPHLEKYGVVEREELELELA